MLTFAQKSEMFSVQRLLVPLEEGLARLTRRRSSFAGHFSTILECLTPVLSVLHPVWNVLRPSIFLEIRSKQPLHSTAWLDGMRGTAAFIVVFAHAGNVYYPWQRHGWSSENPHIFELPVIRLFYSGASMVIIFFVISGYALSYRPLLLARKSDHSKVFDSLASSAFRRGMRLFIPCIVIAFFCVWIDHFGITDTSYHHADHRNDTALDTLWWWFNGVVVGLDPFRTNHRDPWKSPLADIEQTMWTIPLEYRGSLVVFALILILARTRQSLRLGSLGVYLLWLVYVGQWDIFLFVSGMICCEIHHMTHRTVQTPADSLVSAKRPGQRCQWSSFSVIVRLIALGPLVYILSQPEDYLGRGDAPFYATLDAWRPPSWKDNHDAGRFWQCLAGVALVLVVQHTAALRQLFTARFPQYLGKISFCLYLLHALFLKIAGPQLKVRVFGWLSFIPVWWMVEGLGVAVIAALIMPPLFWASDVATRHLDRRSVEFTKWLEEVYNRGEKEKNTPLLATVRAKDWTVGFHNA